MEEKNVEVKIEKILDNTLKLEVEVPKDTFLNIENKVYTKKKGRFNVPGFRKGHATKDIIFKMYGREVFFEDTANDCINETYHLAYKQIKDEHVLSGPYDVTVKEIGADKNFIYEVKVAIAPDFKLPKYKGINIEKTKVNITEDDIKAELLVEQNKNATISKVDREIKNDDIAVIDFEGFIDGKAFDGGKADNFELKIGSHQFIDNFEEQLIGKKAGDEVDVNVTFPADYQVKELQNKPALFKVQIKEVKELNKPEINDEFASEVSSFNTLKEYKEDIKKKLTENAEKKAKNDDEKKIVDELVKKVDINLSDKAIDASIDDIIANIENNLYRQRLDLQTYLKLTNQTMEELRNSQKEAGISNVKTVLLLEKIAKEEKIEVSQEDLDKEIENMAKIYGMDKEKFKVRYMNEDEEESMKKRLIYPKVIEFLYENSK